jgi:HSP20 family molecular chaperone IbpA
MSNIFAPEDIELHLSQGHLTICAETQIQLDQWTSVVRRFRRNLTLPEDIRTEAIATQMDRHVQKTMKISNSK